MLCCDILVGYFQSRDCDKSVGYIHSVILSAMAADVKSVDAVWYMKVVDEINATEEIVDESGRKIIESQIHLKRHNMERITDTKKNIKDKVVIKMVYLFKKKHCVSHCKFWD